MTNAATLKTKGIEYINDVVIPAIIEKVQNGETGDVRLPWDMGNAGYPVNGDGRAYRGVNTFILNMTAMARGYAHNIWLTPNKVKELGGTILKGEHVTWVYFWKPTKYITRDEDTGEDIIRKSLIMRAYKVLNIAQTEGVTLKGKAARMVSEADNEYNDAGCIDEAEAILASYFVRDDAPTFSEGGDSAYYSPSMDAIVIPPRKAYDTLEAFYATANHEVVHSTGHRDRLDRKGNLTPHFGDDTYSVEELTAQMGSGMLSAISGIRTEATDKFDIEYLTNWGRRWKDDPTIFFEAASKAQRAVDYIMGDDKWEDE